jgi:hypothetical protein
MSGENPPSFQTVIDNPLARMNSIDRRELFYTQSKAKKDQGELLETERLEKLRQIRVEQEQLEHDWKEKEKMLVKQHADLLYTKRLKESQLLEERQRLLENNNEEIRRLHELLEIRQKEVQEAQQEKGELTSEFALLTVKRNHVEEEIVSAHKNPISKESGQRFMWIWIFAPLMLALVIYALQKLLKRK